MADILSSKADAKTPVLRIVLSSATDVCRTKTQGGPLDGHQLLYLTVNTFGPNAMPAGPGMYNVSDTSVLNSRMGTEVEAVYAISSDTKTYRATSGLLTLTQVDALAIGGEASLNFATGEAVTIVFNRALRCAALLAQP